MVLKNITVCFHDGKVFKNLLKKITELKMFKWVFGYLCNVTLDLEEGGQRMCNFVSPKKRKRVEKGRFLRYVINERSLSILASKFRIFLDIEKKNH